VKLPFKNILACSLTAASVLSGLSCEKKDHTVTNNQVVLISNDVIGKWSIYSFVDSGVDKSASVSALTLQFNSTGEFLIINNDTTIYGNWQIFSQDAWDELKVTIPSMQMPYSIFNNNWLVGEKTNVALTLYDVTINSPATLYLQRI